jgi:uncharacterized coiled-coil protein SlyX
MVMSEKRFICGLGFPINSDDPIRIISDSVEDKDYYKFSDICDVLNEQQFDLNYLARFIGEFKVDEFKEKLRTLRTFEDKVDEQQATIEQLKKENRYLIRQLEKIPPKIREVWLDD